MTGGHGTEGVDTGCPACAQSRDLLARSARLRISLALINLAVKSHHCYSLQSLDRTSPKPSSILLHD
jgi:hypothetical protein